MKKNVSVLVAISTLALASILMLAPSGVMAAKQTTSGVHFQGPAPTVSCSGSTCTSSQFTLAGLGQGTGTAVLTVNGYWDVTCANPGKNQDVPGQRTTASGTSPTLSFSSDQNGKATISSLTAQLGQPSSSQLATACPNGQWTPTATTPHITSATLTVTFNGQTIYQQTFPA
jgi:hypothetical protein